jgi:hypothetical protein
MWKSLSRALDSSHLKLSPEQGSNLSPTMHQPAPAESSNSMYNSKSDSKITAALKEWAIICQALEEGRQVLLLRKGGIMEYREGFQVKHNKFFLYPTFEHQSIESIQPKYAQKLAMMLQEETDHSKVFITSYARALAVKQVKDGSLLSQLHKYHIWNERYVNVRMNYNPKKPMQVILLRVYKLQNPIEAEVRSEWLGCRSWIHIQSLPSEARFADTSGSFDEQPVLDDSTFDKIASEIEEILT